MFEPRWYADAEGHPLCFSHAQKLGVTDRLTVSEIEAIWAERGAPRPRICRYCDRRGRSAWNLHRDQLPTGPA